MMNGLFELCRLLHERGVKWQQVNDDGIAWADAKGTKYTARLGATFKGPDGTVSVFGMTPAQAVEATLGRGTCKASKQRSMDGKVRGWQCHGCGAAIVTAPSDEEWPELPNYCHNCGRKVVE